jgi:hypothetical protein
MRAKLSWLAVAVILLSGVGEAWASGPCGIYARIEEVVLEPDVDSPTWVLIKGDFLVALDSGRQLAPERGYICFSCVPLKGKNKDKCLIEWHDLQGLVEEKGTGKALVAFGSAFSEVFASFPEVQRTAEQAQQNRFPYPVHHGLTKLRVPTSRDRERTAGDRDRNPAVVLLEFQTRKDQEPAKKDGQSR